MLEPWRGGQPKSTSGSGLQHIWMQQVKNVWIEFGVSLDVASNDACESGLGNLWMKKQGAIG